VSKFFLLSGDQKKVLAAAKEGDVFYVNVRPTIFQRGNQKCFDKDGRSLKQTSAMSLIQRKFVERLSMVNDPNMTRLALTPLGEQAYDHYFPQPKTA
jgi:hypothetical protein